MHCRVLSSSAHVGFALNEIAEKITAYVRRNKTSGGKDGTSSVFQTKLITYPLYYDLARVINDFGLYMKLTPRLTMPREAPALQNMYQVIVSKEASVNSEFGDCLNALKPHFTAYYQHLIQQSHMLPSNLHPSIMFAFLTLYNHWFQTKVMENRQLQLLRGGFYQGSGTGSVPNNIYGTVIFHQDVPAKSIHSFALNDCSDLLNLYDFAAMWFEPINRNDLESEDFKQTLLNVDRWKKKQNWQKPYIQVKRSNSKDPPVTGESTGKSTKRKKRTKQDGKSASAKRGTVTVKSTSEPSEPTTVVARKHRSQNEMMSSDAILNLDSIAEPATESLLEDVKSRIRSFAHNHMATSTIQAKAAYLDIYNRVNGEEYSTFEQLMYNSNTESATMRKTPEDEVANDWLSIQMEKMRRHERHIVTTYPSICVSLSDEVIQELFGYEHISSIMESTGSNNDVHWIVLEIKRGTNSEVYDHYDDESNGCQWITDTVNFIKEAEKNGWTLNDTTVSKSKTRQFIVLCSESMKRRLDGLGKIGIDEDSTSDTAHSNNDDHDNGTVKDDDNENRKVNNNNKRSIDEITEGGVKKDGNNIVDRDTGGKNKHDKKRRREGNADTPPTAYTTPTTRRQRNEKAIADTTPSQNTRANKANRKSPRNGKGTSYKD